MYASKGWPVFPVHSIVDGACSCGKKTCSDAGKHPRTPRGFLDATTDIGQINKWWMERWPNANIGLATGPRSGVWVLDIDVRHEAGKAVKAGDVLLHTISDGRELPETPLSVTGAGGGSHHLFFAWDEGAPIRNKANEGLDVRGDGGYVVLPPSNHISGGVYQWDVTPEDVAPEPAPRWLIEKLNEGNLPGGESPAPTTAWEPIPSKPSANAGVKLPVDDSGSSGPVPMIPIGNTALVAALEPARVLEIQQALAHVDPDLGYQDWVAIAMGLHDETHGSDEGLALFSEWSTRGAKSKGDAECLKKWKSFHVSASRSSKTISTLFKKAWTNPTYVATQHARGVFAPPPEQLISLAGVEKTQDMEILSPSQVMDLRPLPSLIDRVLAQGELAMVYGAPGTGKSFVVLSMAIAVATGSPWFDIPTKPGVVLYGALEGLVGMRGRLLAAMGTDPAVLDGRLWFTEGIRLNDAARLGWIRAEIEKMPEPPALIVVDTLSRAIPGIDENTAKEVTPIIEACRALQRDYGSAVLLVHHTRKDGTSERGSTVIAGAADRKLKVTRHPGEDCPQIMIKGDKAKDDVEFEGVTLNMQTVVLHELPEDDFGRRPTSCRLERVLTETGLWTRVAAISGGSPQRQEQMEIILTGCEPFSESEPITFSQLLAEVSLKGITRTGLQRHVKALEHAGLLERELRGKSWMIWTPASHSVDHPDHPDHPDA
jgi:hypothetical protein